MAFKALFLELSRVGGVGKGGKGRERERASHNEPAENGLGTIHCFVAWRLKPLGDVLRSAVERRESGSSSVLRFMTKVRLAWLFTARYIYILGCRRKFAGADRPPRQNLKKNAVDGDYRW